VHCVEIGHILVADGGGRLGVQNVLACGAIRRQNRDGSGEHEW
jgi:hypothetical protein